MLEIDVDKVGFIIAKAREFETHERPLEEDYKDDLASRDVGDLADDIVEQEEPEDATYDEIVAWISAMNEDDQCQIVALAWVGRGDYTADDFDDALALARQEHNDRTAEYLLGMPLLPDYLDNGLAEFGLNYEA